MEKKHAGNVKYHQRPNLSITGIDEEEVSQVSGTDKIINKITEKKKKTFPNLGTNTHADTGSTENPN